MRYLTTDELIYINEQLPNSDQIHRILKGKQRVRDMPLLESAVGRPMQTVFGEDAYPTLQEKAAALMHSIARNHPFADGNKRTAAIALMFMLEVNGRCVTWEAADALEQILATAEGKLSVSQFAAWLPTKVCDETPEPVAEIDIQTIARIMKQHAWLLDELAAR
jgi:death-on-curing protein